MNSELPKVLHLVLKKPILRCVLDATLEVKPEKIVLVLGHDSESVREAAAGYPAETVIQQPQLGTGHAVMCCEESLGDFAGDILILSGDVPSVSPETLLNFVKSHSESGAEVSFVSAMAEDPRGYGRVVRDPDGRPVRVVEERDATREEKKIMEINAGIYCADSGFLWESLRALDTENSQGEYYLPGIVELCVSRKEKLCVFEAADSKEVLGVNTREELAGAARSSRLAINRRHMENGVTMEDPDSTYISASAVIGRDTVIRPNTHIYGRTRVGKNCEIGPSVYIEDSSLGDGVAVKFSSYLVECRIEDGAAVGPFCHLRPETRVKKRAKIGNFVEVKKSEIGEDSKVSHLSYVGDSDIGDGVNIGAGTITCNYDGREKHRTVIEDEAFVGSDTILVAPVKIGRGAVTGAGSTITRDVSAGALAIERSQQKEIEGWAKRSGQGKEKS